MLECKAQEEHDQVRHGRGAWGPRRAAAGSQKRGACEV